MSESYGKVGFASPASANKVIKRRVSVELTTTVGLAVCLIVALTAVSIGAAHAQVLRAVGENKDASLTIAAAVALVVAGLRGVARSTAVAARNRMPGADPR